MALATSETCVTNQTACQPGEGGSRQPLPPIYLTRSGAARAACTMAVIGSPALPRCEAIVWGQRRLLRPWEKQSRGHGNASIQTSTEKHGQVKTIRLRKKHINNTPPSPLNSCQAPNESVYSGPMLDHSAVPARGFAELGCLHHPIVLRPQTLQKNPPENRHSAIHQQSKNRPPPTQCTSWQQLYGRPA